jgi:hypothetical protein
MTTIRIILVLVLASTQAIAGLFPDLVGIENDVGDAVAPYRTALVPIGWAFAIWWVIYLGNLVFALDHARAGNSPGMAKVGWFAAGAFLVATFWVWHQPTYGPGVFSFIFLEVLLALALLAAFFTKDVHRPDLFGRTGLASLSFLAGWVTVASPAGFSLALQFIGWSDFARDDTQAVLPILFGWLPLAWGLTFVLRSWAYAIPIVWGLFGVAMANTSDPGFLIGIGAVATSFPGLTAFARSRMRTNPHPGPA